MWNNLIHYLKYNVGKRIVIVLLLLISFFIVLLSLGIPNNDYGGCGASDINQSAEEADKGDSQGGGLDEEETLANSDATLKSHSSSDKGTKRALFNFKSKATILANNKSNSSNLRGLIHLSKDESELIKLEEFQFVGKSIKIPLANASDQSGVLSFRMKKGSSPQTLEIDSNGNFKISIEGSFHYPLIDKIKGFRPQNSNDPIRDEYESYSEQLDGVINGKFSFRNRNNRDNFDLVAKIALKTKGDPLLSPLSVNFTIKFKTFFYIPNCNCVGRKLCIQPIGVKSSVKDASPTGTALNALLPHAKDIWSRSCISFEVRKMQYVINDNWKTITEDAQEETDLRNSVNIDDCIEVFFIEHWDPEDANGGGVTSSGGEASAKIITSDDNDNGIDLHHLAHELGHVLDLKHPGSGCPSEFCPDRVDGSSGTVICPSGFEKDNPDIQSEENGDLGNNPLTEAIVNQYILQCPQPDCTNSNDCGNCP